jgi:cellobiose-specific phosphotransferase system component IIC
MLDKDKKGLIIFLLIILVSSIFLILTDVKAANLQDAFKDEYLGKTAREGAGYDTTVDTEDIISIIIQVALSFLGVIFLVLMIYGGYLWMMAKGNEEQVTKAKNLITAAMIGLIIVLAAYAISWFVISKLGGTTLKSTP